MTDEVRMFVLTVEPGTTPYKDWAAEDAAHYSNGYIDAVEGVAFSNRNPESYIQGYAMAVAIFGDRRVREEFAKIRTNAPHDYYVA